MEHVHQGDEGHSCLLCGAKQMVKSIDCGHCGGVLKVILAVGAFAALFIFVF